MNSENKIDLHVHDGHNATLLVVNTNTGEILFGANDERYTLVKNQGGFPLKTLEVAKKKLKFKNINIRNIYFSTKTQPFVPNSKKSRIRTLFDLLVWFTPKEIFKNYLFTKLYTNDYFLLQVWNRSDTQSLLEAVLEKYF